MKKYTTAFTVVELLIVIVVVVILAMISIATYNGVQERAYNAKIVAGVKQYREALEMYHTKHKGTYPKTGPEEQQGPLAVTVVCLGRGYVDEYCGRITWTDTYEDPVFNQRIASVMGSVPQVNNQLMPAGPEEFVGAVYGVDRIDRQSGETDVYWRTLQYALHGENADCVLAGAWAYRRTTVPRPTTACIIELESAEH